LRAESVEAQDKCEEGASVSGGIYLVKDDGELVEMNERGYDTEDLLPGPLP
jgi:hypothetical protein